MVDILNINGKSMKVHCKFCKKTDSQVALILKIDEDASICNDCVSIASFEVNKHLKQLTGRYDDLVKQYDTLNSAHRKLNEQLSKLKKETREAKNYNN